MMAELPTAVGASSLRKRTRTACTRCKNRKQKCDDHSPTCGSCLRAGVECDKTDVSNESVSNAYTNALEEHVALLERQLAEQSQALERIVKRPRLSSPEPSYMGAFDESSPESPGTLRPGLRTTERANVSRGVDENALNEVVGIISLGHFEAPAYVGPSAGLSLAMNLGEMVQATVWKRAFSEIRPRSTPATNSAYGGSDRPQDSTSGNKTYGNSSSSHRRAMTIEELARHSVKEPPSDELGSELVHAYFQQLHPRYPFLSPDEIWSLHKQRLDLATANHLSMAQRFNIFKLYMVYAMGSTLQQLVEKKSTTSPESFYTTALQYVVAAKESRTIHNIEAMVLLVVYHLRSASGHGLWYMVGLAMRTCVDLGLHRKSQEQGLSGHEIQRNRRLFWTVYSLERNVAISLGRPLSIIDRHIDVEFPASSLRTDGSLSSPSSPFCFATRHSSLSPGEHIPDSSCAHQSCSRSDDIRVAIFLFEMRRIESRIHHSVYRTDKPLSVLRSKIDKHYEALEAWRISVTEAFSPNDHLLDYPLMLNYHRSVRLLIQPFLPVLSPTEPYYSLCLRAAGKICQTHKRMHQAQEYGHSFIAVQTVFVAGVTLLYGLWTHSLETWSATLSNDIRACSLVLFVMGERAPWVRKYRDAFEVLVNAAMEKLHDGDSRLADMAADAQAQARPRTQHNAWASNQHVNRHSGPKQQQGRGRPGVNITGDNRHNLHDTEALNHPEQQDYTEPGPILNNTEADDDDIWRVVTELATMIDPDEEAIPTWIPNFDTYRIFHE